MNEKIYMDNAATTKVKESVFESMKPYFCDCFGNPSSIHSEGMKTARAIQEAREHVAKVINAKPEEIYFTSGGSESDNWAIRGLKSIVERKKTHIITSQIEHKAILNSCKHMESIGYSVTYLPVDKHGLISPKALQKAIQDETGLISIMSVNNEIGTVQRIEEIGSIAEKYNIPFHTDAVQAYGKIPIDVNDCRIDMLSISAHKINGPKGVGALYIRNGIQMTPLIFGGYQENGMRAGTENVPGIVGMGASAKGKTNESIFRYNKTLIANRNYFLRSISSNHIPCTMNGHLIMSYPGIISLTFSKIDSQMFLSLLDATGIQVSAGSACMTGTDEPSHVLKAIGLTDEEAKSTIRISMGLESKETIDCLVEALKNLSQWMFEHV